jgi:hypothetical protein
MPNKSKRPFDVKRLGGYTASHAQRAADYLHRLQPQAGTEHPEQDQAAA